MASTLCSIVCLLALGATVSAYSSGAPEDACLDMIPQHGVGAEKSAAPYTITTPTKQFKAGQPVQVVITGNTEKNTIKGFLLQARQGTKPVGQFKLAPGDKFAQLRSCGAPANAVTHMQHAPSDDRNTLTFTWIPPNDFTGEIKFRSTIAQNGHKFWVGVESPPITIA